MPDGVLRSLLVDGVIAGTGAVLVFLPQILILFFFILVLEDSGYLPRAAFCWTASWARWACRGAPSFRCCPALPAPCRHHGHALHHQLARPPADHHDRAADDLLGRLPVYALLIGAFIPSAPWPASSICRAWCCLRCMWAASSVPWPWPGWPSWPQRRPARRC
jgi:ferrous iron transport protein B